MSKDMSPSQKLQGIVDDANKRPYQSYIACVMDHLHAHPELAEWSNIGELFASDILTNASGRAEPAIGTAILANQAYYSLMYDLGFAAASPLERVVIGHVALCWAVLQEMTMIFALSVQQAEGETIEFWEERTSAAQCRFERALTALTRIRKVPPEVLEALVLTGTPTTPPDEQLKLAEGRQADASASSAESKAGASAESPT